MEVLEPEIDGWQMGEHFLFYFFGSHSSIELVLIQKKYFWVSNIGTNFKLL